MEDETDNVSPDIHASVIKEGPHDERIVALGRKLVDELGRDNSTDTLARWMANYIAELMSVAEMTSAKESDAAKHECFTAILALWQRRAGMPNGMRPFEELEPIVRALESLDPENEVPRYYRMARPPEGEEADTLEQAKWLDLVDRLDQAAKAVIGYCLAEAADAALDKAKPWVQLAQDIEPDDLPTIVVRMISKIEEENKEPDPNEPLRARLNDRLERLRGFLSAAELVADHLEQRIQEISPKGDSVQ